jgi:hypothetical protein
MTKYTLTAEQVLESHLGKITVEVMAASGVLDGILAAMEQWAYIPASLPSNESTPEPSKQEGVMSGVSAIAKERQRQVEKEGWTPDHDNEHKWGELAIAAACYALHHTDASVQNPHTTGISGWPWEQMWWKPKDTLSNLARAGALIAAEYDRQQRLAALTPPSPAPQENPDPENAGITMAKYTGAYQQYRK